MSKNNQKEIISLPNLKENNNRDEKLKINNNKNDNLNILGDKNDKKENNSKTSQIKENNNNFLNQKRERTQSNNKEIEEENNNNLNRKKTTVSEAKKEMKDFESLILSTEKEIQKKYGCIFPDLSFEDNLPDEIKNKLLDDFLESPNIKKILIEANNQK